MWTTLFAQVGAPVELPTVSVEAKALRNPVEKSYRNMVDGMDLFEQEKSRLAPGATLRFKLLPRRSGTDMDRIELEVLGTETAFPIPVAPTGTFDLPRNAQAYAEDAQVVPNRGVGSMTWRAEVRTPGLPAGTRRMGDLRLECRVGMASGLVSNPSTLVGWLVRRVLESPAYCDRQVPQYLFFADRALFSVVLNGGGRRESLSIGKLYAGAIDNPRLAAELPYCDCESLVDRTFVLPLGDLRWADDTVLSFEYMDEP